MTSVYPDSREKSEDMATQGHIPTGLNGQLELRTGHGLASI